MIKQPLRAVLFLVVLLLLQVVVFDHVVLGGYVIPYVYVLGVLLLPFCFGRGKAMLGAFVVGLVVDLFQQSGGLHAMACVLTVYLCGPLTRVFFRLSEKELEGFDPFTAKNGRTAGLSLLLVLLLIQYLVLYWVEAGHFSALPSALGHAFLGAGATFAVSVVILSLNSVRSGRSRRRQW